MNNHYSLPLLALLAWAALWIKVDSSITYCSSVRTGSSSANFSIYQSQGNCEQHCSDSAFGILLDKNCWCSDIAPNKATNVDISKCDDDCPGYPDDTCGNAADELYGYIQLGNPSGTATAPTTSTTHTSTTSTKSDSSTTTTSHTSVVETNDGQVTTITIGGSDSTSVADSATASAASSGGSSGISGGTIAGIVVGVVGGIALVVAAIIFFLAKRRQNSDSPDGSQNGTIDGRQSKGSQMSYANAKGMFGDNHSHTLSNGSSHTPQRMPTFTDNRLNTGAVLYPNGRRSSDVSLQDNEDYSRPVLRLTNPD
ncbi:hypothetical protein BJY01DRAFT_210917 [Aspergillus pseudoustus]|uniref:WSC domain-containing protein n=1 Tax=Aspergillus pseudoustus TaxID=1810923 RepID=A0ABR4KAB3_9EURO